MPPGGCKRGRDGRNLKLNYLRLIPGKFKMTAGDVISIREQVREYMYFPTGIKRELVRFGVDCD